MRSGTGPLLALSDEALAARVRRGDREAFRPLYERYHQGVYRYALGLLRRREDAEEALQEAMTRALAALVGGTEVRRFRGWLFRIAHRECMDLLGGRGRRAELPDELLDAGPGVERRAELNDDVRALARDLMLLPAEQRAALLLRELSGLSHEEIAVALGGTASGAKQLIYEARRSLLAFGEGRAVDCPEIRRRLSHGDGRVLRGRGLRGHVAACGECRAFGQALRARPAHLAALAPPLPAAAAAGLLESVMGGAGGAGVAAGGLAALGSGLPVKALMVATLAVAGGTVSLMPFAPGGGDAPPAGETSTPAAVLATGAAPAARAGASAAPRPRPVSSRPRHTAPARSPVTRSSSTRTASVGVRSAPTAAAAPGGAETPAPERPAGQPEAAGAAGSRPEPAAASGRSDPAPASGDVEVRIDVTRPAVSARASIRAPSAGAEARASLAPGRAEVAAAARAPAGDVALGAQASVPVPASALPPIEVGVPAPPATPEVAPPLPAPPAGLP
jgi:RNA polymerase sigma factor (sigma-70 family)